jgi:hypothetical protein
MLEGLAEGCLGCVGQILGEALGDAITSRRNKRVQAVFTGGHEVRMHCSVRRPAESADWSHGLLTVSITGGTWRARYKRGDRVTVQPATTSYLEHHPVTPADGLKTTLPMTVIVFNHSGQRLELAVMNKDVSMLRKVFWASWPEDRANLP